MSIYRVTKTFGHNLGLSATFRQHRAKSHCQYLHGYALGFEIILECDEASLDENGWVYNFGGFKPFKTWLEETFDHKTLVAIDDPKISIYRELHTAGLIQLKEVAATGCEAFAKMAYHKLQGYLNLDDRAHKSVRIVSVECREHAGNSATFCPADHYAGVAFYKAVSEVIDMNKSRQTRGR